MSERETKTCGACGDDVTTEARSLFAVGAAKMASYEWLCAACTGAVQDFIARLTRKGEPK